MKTALLVFMFMNMVRTDPLVQDPILMDRAQDRAEYLCDHNQWSHDNWLQSFDGIRSIYKGENLARDFKSPKKEFAALIESTTHRNNIIKKEYKKVGIGSDCGIHVYLFSS